MYIIFKYTVATQQTMLNHWLYYTIQYLEPNTKSRRWW